MANSVEKNILQKLISTEWETAFTYLVTRSDLDHRQCLPGPFPT